MLVPVTVAKDVIKVVGEYGAKPVDVFVDDNVDTISRASDAADLEFLQVDNYVMLLHFFELVIG